MPHRMKSCWRYPFRLVSANQAASAPRSSTTSPRSRCGRVLVRSRTGPCMGTTAVISNLLRLGRPQNPLRSEKKNQDQRLKNEGITVGGERVREQGDQENLAKTEDVCAQYGPWNRAESPDDSRAAIAFSAVARIATPVWVLVTNQVNTIIRVTAVRIVTRLTRLICT